MLILDYFAPDHFRTRLVTNTHTITRIERLIENRAVDPRDVLDDLIPVLPANNKLNALRDLAVEWALNETNFNFNAAARLLNASRQTLTDIWKRRRLEDVT